jgi:hypothetical protein
MMDIWPETVTHLTKKDICRGSYNDGYGRHCLVGWVQADFADRQDVQQAALRAVREVVLSLVPDIKGADNPDPESPLLFFADNKKYSKDTIAGVYNLAMRNLGYTEDA